MRWIALADAISNVAAMRVRVEAENVERVKANLQSLIEVVNKGNRASVQTHQAMNTVGTEMRGRLREQNLLINSWRIMHPQLSLLTRGLSNVATVGHTLVNVFQSLNIMQLRQKESARDLADAVQKQKDLTVQYQKTLKDFGPDDFRTVELKGQLNEVNGVVDNLTNNLNIEKWQDIGTKISAALSLVGVGANIMNARNSFLALRISMIGTGGEGGIIGATKLLKTAFASMWVKALAPIAVILGLDYVIAKMRNLPSVLEIAAAEFPTLDFSDMLPTIESSKKAQELINKRIAGEVGGSLIAASQLPSTTPPYNPSVPQAPIPIKPAPPDWWDQLKNSIISIFSIRTNAGLAFGETGGGISNVAGVPFGPPQPTARENYITGGGNYGKAKRSVQVFTDTVDADVPIIKDMGDTVKDSSDATRDLTNRTTNLNGVMNTNINDMTKYIPNLESLDEKTRIAIGSYGKNVALVEGNSESLVISSDKLKKWSETHKVGVDTLNPLIKKYADGTLTTEDLNNSMGKTATTLEAFRRFVQSITISRKGKFSAGFPDVGAAETATPGGTLVTHYQPGFGGLEAVPIIQGGVNPAIAGAFVNLIPNNPADLKAGFVMELLGKTKGLNIETYNAIQRAGGDTQGMLKELFRGMFPEYNFAEGGLITEHVKGIGMRSGAVYNFGEAGIETVSRGASGGNITIHVHGSLITQADLINKVSEAIARKVQGMV